jgi:hypothetical protein
MDDMSRGIQHATFADASDFSPPQANFRLSHERTPPNCSAKRWTAPRSLAKTLYQSVPLLIIASSEEINRFAGRESCDIASTLQLWTGNPLACNLIELSIKA